MGYHISWIGFQNRSLKEISARIGLAETGAREHLPESDILAISLASGWHIIFFNNPLPKELKNANLEQLSRVVDIVTCLVEEASMVSMSSSYVNGVKQWRVAHDSERGHTNLEAQGNPPSGYPEIRDKLLAKQNAAGPNGVDYVFDVPINLARHLTGFRHDDPFDESEEPQFLVLRRIEQT